MINPMKVELGRHGGVLGLDKKVRIMDGVLEVTENGSVQQKRRVTVEQSQAIEEAAAGLPKLTRIRATDSDVSDAMDTYLSIESERGERLRYVLAPGSVDPAVDKLVGMIDAAESAASEDAS
jgi:NADH:ubiquinone oxidoreductase subunit D